MFLQIFTLRYCEYFLASLCSRSCGMHDQIQPHVAQMSTTSDHFNPLVASVAFSILLFNGRPPGHQRIKVAHIQEHVLPLHDLTILNSAVSSVQHQITLR